MDGLHDDIFSEQDLREVLYDSEIDVSPSNGSLASLENRLAEEVQEIANIIQEVPSQDPLTRLLKRVVQRRPYISALALISPGGRLWASSLPGGIEAESVAAMAAPVALLGRRVSLEQLGSDMRQAYVEGEGGYAILRAIGEAAILLVIASTDSNLGLILHDVDLLEDKVAQLLGIVARESRKWTDAAPSIESLRKMVSEGRTPGAIEAHMDDLRTKLASLELGFFPDRIVALREKLQYPHHLKEAEAELLALEKDVMAALEQDMDELTVSAEAAMSELEQVVATESEEAPEIEPLEQKNSFLRRALKWLALTIASDD